MAVYSSRSTVTTGELPLAPALEGWWTLPNFPERVWIDGRLFRRADWRQPYERVVEQYREDVPRDSMHLKVYSSGRWIVDHIDQDNPDLGRPLEHFFNDHPVGKTLKAAAPLIALAVVGVAISHIAERSRPSALCLLRPAPIHE